MKSPEEAESCRVAVVLVNWRAPDMTLLAVESVFAQIRRPEHVFVVENGSDDESAVLLKEGLTRWSGQTTLILNDRNLGFGGGCNSAIRVALGEDFSHIWLLNNDARPDPECLANLLVAATAQSDDIGAVGSLLIDPTGRHSPHFGSWMRPVVLTCKNVESACDLDHHYSWCTAASLLLKAVALRKIGGFDEGFFMYWEDADLIMRLRGAGYDIVCSPNARVKHEAGTSSAEIPTLRYLWHFDSQRRFLAKHHSSRRVAITCLWIKFLLKSLLDRDFRRFQALLQRALSFR